VPVSVLRTGTHSLGTRLPTPVSVSGAPGAGQHAGGSCGDGLGLVELWNQALVENDLHDRVDGFGASPVAL
jgi:hypothetical protein